MGCQENPPHIASTVFVPIVIVIVDVVAKVDALALGHVDAALTGFPILLKERYDSPWPPLQLKVYLINGLSGSEHER